ncbi:hypothetical protein ACFSTH_05690 [Paenibacillus yanchengensis]
MNWHYIKKYMPKTGNVLDNGAGSGKYSMELAKESLSTLVHIIIII